MLQFTKKYQLDSSDSEEEGNHVSYADINKMDPI